jgi:hypothetical protein
MKEIVTWAVHSRRRSQPVGKQRRILFWLAGGLGVIILALLLTLTVVAPRVINLESIKGQIQAEFTKTAGGDLDFERMDLSFFPRPRVIIRWATVEIPERARGTLRSLKICPEILPLFRGRLRVAKVSVEVPDFELPFPQMPGPRKKETRQNPFELLEKEASSLFGMLASHVPNLEVQIRKGSIVVVDRKRSVMTLQDLDARVILPPRGLKFRFTCGSNLWKDLSVEGTLDARTLDGKGHIELSRFQPHLLTDRLLTDTDFGCSESNLYLRVDVRTDGLRKFHGELKTSAPEIRVSRGKEESVLQVENMGASFSIEEDKIALSLDQLRVDHPRLSMTGSFLMDRAAPDVRLDLEARDLDLDSSRKAALCLLGDIRIVKDIFAYVRGGQLPVITFHSQGKTIGELGATNSIHIETRMEDGTVFVRGPDLMLEDVNADAVVSMGILEAKGADGRLGNSRGHDVTVRVGLKGGDALLHVDIKFLSDLKEVPDLLKRIVKNDAFVEEVSRTADVSGSARGRLILGESTKSVQATVDVSELNISGRYGRIPHVVKISKGTFFYAPDRISGEAVDGEVGQSSFSGMSYQLLLDKERQLVLKGGTATLSMDQIVPWLLSYRVLRNELDEFREDVKGEIKFTELTLEGPLLRPADWDFEATGSLENLDVATTLCPGTAALATGRFSADEEELSFTDVKARILDASFDASGVLNGYLTGLREADLDLRGRTGPEATQWISQSIDLPPAFKPRSPFNFADGKLLWSRNGETSFKGNAAFPEGVKVSIDVLQKPEELLVNGLSFQDKASRATLSFSQTKNAYGLKFTGNLTYGTLEKVFANNVAPDVNLKGDFLLNIRLDKPEHSKAQGYLEAKSLRIPYGWMAPIEIESLSLDASEKGIKVDNAHLKLEKTHISLEGDLDFSDEGLLFDMDLASEAIEWAAIERTLDRAEATGQQEMSSRLPVEGTVRCRAESFTYGQFTWQPLHASVTFARDTIRAAVTDADLCGIATLGALNITPQDTSLDFRLVSNDRDLAPTFPCLSETEREVTGRFNLTGEVKGEGKGDILIRSLKGRMEFSARDGQVYRDPVWSKIFSLLNVTEVFRGKKVDLGSDDLAYDTLAFKADLENGNLLIREFVLEGPTMGIAGQGSLDLVEKKGDITLLLAPLRTVDFIVEKTPVVSSIMGGKLLTVPVRVKGDWEDPQVTMLSATSVGTRLLGMLKNTLMLPVDIIEPAIPGERAEEDLPP